MKSSLSYSILENITEDIFWRGFDYFKKHIAAVAIARDLSKNLQLLSEKEISELTIEVVSNFSQKVDQMFKHPLKADLEFLAKASEYSSWTRPHAKIPLSSTIDWISLELSKKEVLSGNLSVGLLGTLGCGFNSFD